MILMIGSMNVAMEVHMDCVCTMGMSVNVHGVVPNRPKCPQAHAYQDEAD